LFLILQLFLAKAFDLVKSARLGTAAKGSRFASLF
jgi:hypothetical protein